MTKLINNISVLAGVQNPSAALRGQQMSVFPAIHDAWLLVEGGVIAGFGSMNDGSVPKGVDPV
jgi:hypothetical protein